MIHSKNSFSIYNLPPFQQQFLTEDMLLFDIETTGLSAVRDSVYCIGCGRRAGDDIITDLFFAEQPAEEPAVIDAFTGLLENHPVLITFNGTTFDIPFLRKRVSRYEALFSGFTFIDLYREALGMKSLLSLPSYRQKSIEQFLGFQREDPYDGGELTGVYHRYVSAPDAESLSVLLQHNEEDVRGMFDLIGLLSWQQLRDGKFEITDIKTEFSSFIDIKIRPDFAFPKAIRVRDETASLRLDREIGQIRFPVCRGTLKYFFSEPENYYYLPEEDCAVHKSVGVFVDSAHRRKATLKNCYTKKECDYISIPVKSENDSPRMEYRDSHSFLILPAQAEEAGDFLEKYFSLFFRK